jgi:hypothetical protein
LILFAWLPGCSLLPHLPVSPSCSASPRRSPFQDLRIAAFAVHCSLCYLQSIVVDNNIQLSLAKRGIAM